VQGKAYRLELKYGAKTLKWKVSVDFESDLAEKILLL
jgi:hypothetical protein